MAQGIPVSYTHLDVYKRQDQARHAAAVVGGDDLLIELLQQTHTAAPVSYTHLDVYKRQV